MSSAYIQKLGLKTSKTNVGAQKIDNSTLKIFGIVIANFQMENKISKARFFQKTFLIINTKFEMILGIPLLKLNNADVLFGKKNTHIKVLYHQQSPTNNQASLTN